MIKNFYLALSLATSLVQAQTFSSPDIVLDTKLNYDWSSFLVNKFQKIAKNIGVIDPFNGSFPGKTLLNEAKIGPILPVESKELLKDFGDAIGLRIIDSETKVWVEDFYYDVKGFKSQLKASQQQTDGIVLGTEFSASEVTLRAGKLSLSIVIPGVSNSPIFNVDIEKPVIRASEEKLINFFTKIKIQDQKDFFNLQLLEASFDQMAEGLLVSNDQVELDYERIVIPAVSLRVGTKVISFSQEKIERLIREKHTAIKGLLLAQAADFLSSNTTKSALKIFEQYKIQKEFWLAASAIQSQIKLGSFTSRPERENIQVSLYGDFCSDQKFNQFKQKCTEIKDTKTAPTRLTPQLHKKSLGVIRDLMVNKGAEVVASISEDYVNKLLVSTYDAGLWNDVLKEAGVRLGPNKVVMRMEKKGDSGTLVMDVIYVPTKFEKLLTGSQQIRFPLVLDVSLRIENHSSGPVIIVRLNDVDTSDETLTNGRPDLNILSTVKETPRFKSKVIKAIREKISVLGNKDVVELRYPQLKSFGLDKVDFRSDGMGRMNAILRMEDLLLDDSI